MLDKNNNSKISYLYSLTFFKNKETTIMGESNISNNNKPLKLSSHINTAGHVAKHPIKR
jgi:hypothetical protein